MKTFKFLFSLVLTIALAIALNTKIGEIPPLAKLLSPWHGYLQNIETSEEGTIQSFKSSEIKSETKVYFDELNFPHIYAQNDEDLYFVQGYLTAKDRLWQMDFFSRVVMGRLSEVIGKRAANFDKLNRRIGLKKMTHEVWENAKQNDQLRIALQSYSKGVNAYIEELSYPDYPIEFKILDYEPEPWSPLKSCLAYALLSNTLSRSEADLENTNAMALFGKEMYDLMFPEELGNLDPVIPQGKKWDFIAQEVASQFRSEISKTLATIDKPSPLYGSNNFVAAGSKTKNGNVIFANEPDLQLTQPSIWHAIHLHTDKINTMGVTVPGTPTILIGFNDSIVWGVTNSPRDQVDWYKIEFRDKSRKEYRYNNQWFKTEKVVEEIKIRGEKSLFDTVVYVHHGPLVYDRNFYGDKEKSNYAMKWIAHSSGNTFPSLYEINRSKNYQEFETALKSFTGPPQNFLFGSSAGDIAVNLPGTFPIKPKGMGKFLLDGADINQEWNDHIPFEHRMLDKNPVKGFLSSANQHPVDSLYPYYTYDHHYEYYRNRRINDRLKTIQNIEPDDFMKLQNDNFNYHASESLPAMLNALDTSLFQSSHRDYVNSLSKWDYFNSPEIEEPTLYQLWWDILYEKIWDEYDTVSISINKPHRYITNHLLINNPEFPFFDILETNKTETARDLYQSAFNESVDSLKRWSEEHEGNIDWYNYKNTGIRHLLRLKPFSEENIIIGGGKGIVNAASRFAGPSWRMVVEMDPEGTKAWGIYPGSQTGNPGSGDYGHMIEKWAKGEYFELLFGQDISKSEKVKSIQKFKPE
ncbi:MAG: penicillin acylase family protein [Cyclobacteriaceae bacterium]